MGNIVLSALLIFAGWYGYSQYQQHQRRALGAVEEPPEVAASVAPGHCQRVGSIAMVVSIVHK
jgi:hypothetical protein